MRRDAIEEGRDCAGSGLRGAMRPMDWEDGMKMRARRLRNSNRLQSRNSTSMATVGQHRLLRSSTEIEVERRYRLGNGPLCWGASLRRRIECMKGTQSMIRQSKIQSIN